MKYKVVQERDRPIGVLDSGIGGLSTLMALKEHLPRENFIYICPDSFEPFGNMPESTIFQKSAKLVDTLMQQNCKAIVIACNTATNVGVANLKLKYKVPFVGCEPAIKPAVEQGNKNILVLCTVSTSRQPKFVELKKKYDNIATITVAPQTDLAKMIDDTYTECVQNNDTPHAHIIQNEILKKQYKTTLKQANLYNNTTLDKSNSYDYTTPDKSNSYDYTTPEHTNSQNCSILDDFYTLLQKNLTKPVHDILDQYPDIDGIVLGCTHYVFLSKIITDYYTSKNKTISLHDGNTGIAKRLRYELGKIRQLR